MFKFNGSVRVYLGAIDEFLLRHPLAEPHPLSYTVVVHKRRWPFRGWQLRCIEGDTTCLTLAWCAIYDDAQRWRAGFEFSNAFDRPSADEWLAWRNERTGISGVRPPVPAWEQQTEATK